MIVFHKLVATCFGIGFLKPGAGTWAAVFVCLGLWLSLYWGHYGLLPHIILTLILTFLGIWSSDVLEKEWGKDSQFIVVDEAAGMSISLIFLPLNMITVTFSFVLFRILDIYKPLYIRRMEKLKSGWGVMGDDILAGIYTNLIMQLAVAINLNESIY